MYQLYLSKYLDKKYTSIKYFSIAVLIFVRKINDFNLYLYIYIYYLFKNIK